MKMALTILDGMSIQKLSNRVMAGVAILEAQRERGIGMQEGTLDLIMGVVVALRDMEAEGEKVTLMALYNLLVERGIVAKGESGYDKVKYGCYKLADLGLKGL
jgi:hypothetical protein